jgi:hypothetical protein
VRTCWLAKRRRRTITSVAMLPRLLAAEHQDVRPTDEGSMTPNPQPNPETVEDEESFLAFVRTLAADRRLAARIEGNRPDGYDAPRGWQNDTIEQFLESALSWAEDTEFGRTQGLPDNVTPWRRLAVFLYTGKIYE